MSSSPTSPRGRTTAFVIVIVIGAATVLIGFLADLSITLVWPLTLLIVLIGLGVSTWLTREDRSPDS